MAFLFQCEVPLLASGNFVALKVNIYNANSNQYHYDATGLYAKSTSLAYATFTRKESPYGNWILKITQGTISDCSSNPYTFQLKSIQDYGSNGRIYDHYANYINVPGSNTGAFFAVAGYSTS